MEIHVYGAQPHLFCLCLPLVVQPTLQPRTSLSFLVPHFKHFKICFGASTGHLFPTSLQFGVADLFVRWQTR